MKKEINMKNVMAAYAAYKSANTGAKGACRLAVEQAAEKVTAELEALQHRCSARTIDIFDICFELAYIDNKLVIAKKAMEGITVVVDHHAQNFPNAYKYTPESTIFEAVYRKGSWWITDIRRANTRRSGHGTQITLTDEAKTAILAKYSEF